MAAVVGAIGVLAAPAVAQAATTYTVDSAAGGACTPADPNCTTISAAAGVAAPGDTVQIKPGSYAESPTFTQSSLTVKGIGSGIAAVTGQLKVSNATNFTISRLVLRSLDTTPLVITTPSPGFPLTTDTIVVEGSTIFAAKAVPALTVAATTVSTQTINATVRHVTTASLNGPSISFTSSGGGTFNPAVKNSIALGGVDPGTAATSNDDTSPFSAVQSLVCDGFLHLVKSSSAIGAGGSLDAGEVTEDIDGEARGTTPDRGGDQYSNKCDPPPRAAQPQLPPTPVLTPPVIGGPAAPNVSITSPRQGSVVKRTAKRRRGSRRKPRPKAVALTGTAADPLGLASVQLALRRTGGGTTTCEWFNGKKLAKVPCAQVILLQATLRDRTWTYKIPASASLPKGSYLLYATAINRAGIAATTFSQAAGNLVSFKVK
jgi:hypothetical protein